MEAPKYLCRIYELRSPTINFVWTIKCDFSVPRKAFGRVEK